MTTKQSAIQRVSYYAATPVETCDRCNAGIKNVFTVRYVDGLTAKFGSECINKILAGDNSLKSLFAKNSKLLQKRLRQLAALSLPVQQMPRGREYYGSGLYFIADEDGEDVFTEHWFFHPVVDEERNANSQYFVQDPQKRFADDLKQIEKGKAWLAKDIARLEVFLARVINKGLLAQQNGGRI